MTFQVIRSLNLSPRLPSLLWEFDPGDFAIVTTSRVRPIPVVFHENPENPYTCVLSMWCFKWSLASPSANVWRIWTIGKVAMCRHASQDWKNTICPYWFCNGCFNFNQGFGFPLLLLLFVVVFLVVFVVVFVVVFFFQMVVFVVLVFVSYAPRCSVWVFLVKAVHMTSRHFDTWTRIAMAHSDSEIETTNYQKIFVSASHLSQVKVVYISYIYIHTKKHVFLARDDFLTILPWSCSFELRSFGESLSFANLLWKYLNINFMVSCPRDCWGFFWVHVSF